MKQSARVLARRGARELTTVELESVSGGGLVHTNVASVALATSTHTGVGDGDGVGDIDITH
jgi:hypothetical protein